MNTVNIRNLSIKCGYCNSYQTLCAYRPEGDLNVYTYECDNDICDPEKSRTLVEVLREIDEFANRDPGWRGGGRHGEEGSGEAGDATPDSED